MVEQALERERVVSGVVFLVIKGEEVDTEARNAQEIRKGEELGAQELRDDKERAGEVQRWQNVLTAIGEQEVGALRTHKSSRRVDTSPTQHAVEVAVVHPPAVHSVFTAPTAAMPTPHLSRDLLGSVYDRDAEAGARENVGCRESGGSRSDDIDLAAGQRVAATLGRFPSLRERVGDWSTCTDPATLSQPACLCCHWRMMLAVRRLRCQRTGSGRSMEQLAVV
jgi:hypothetical protein